MLESDEVLHDPAQTQPAIIPLEDEHTKAAKQLWMTRFGALEDRADQWLADARLSSDNPTQGFVATRGGTVVAFGITTVANSEYVRHYCQPADVEVWETTGINHILVVDADHEGEGIGSQLVEARLRYLAAVTNAQGVIGVSWHRDDHHDSRPLFEKYDFEAVETVPEYYDKQDGLAPCPDCEGDGECYCDATVYRRPLDTEVEA